MPQALIIIFLLFFAVLAFGWFYWQRAKARATDVATATPAESAPVAPATTEQPEPTESTPAS